MKKYMLIIVLLLTSSQITWSQSKAEKKAIKEAKEVKAYEDVKAMLDEGAFFFNADWVYPRSTSQINLINNPGIITFKSIDSVKIYLPYFGIVRIGGGFNQSAAIQHIGAVSDFKVKHNDKKRASTISFTAKSPTELYDVSMTVFDSGNASIFINSSKRDGIRYRGTISAIKEEEFTRS